MEQDSTTQMFDSPKAKGKTLGDQRAKHEAAIQVLRSLREGGKRDEKEQRETWAYLKKALDEDRLSDRKLFP